MARIEFINDENNAQGEVQGSDARLNVSSRSDSRAYYNSRDKSESYSVVFDDANADAGDYILYIKNTKTDGKELVVRSAGVNCEAAGSSFKLSMVTGTPSGGATLTPANLNQAGQAKSATTEVYGPADSSSTPMTGLTEDKTIDHAGISGAWGHEEFRLGDTLRLGQDQACAIELDSTTAADVRAFGVVFFFFE